MYDVYFSYFDGCEYRCRDINKICIPASGGIKTISGEDILTSHFKIYPEIYLYSENSNYTVSTENLKIINITKK